MAFWDNEPVGIIFFGGVKVNNLESGGTFSIGETNFQSLYSQAKNNVVSGQTFGDFGFNNLQPIASPLYDPDGSDTAIPVAFPSPLGLED